MSAEPDERDELVVLRLENVRLHEQLAAAKRLNEILCKWGNDLEARIAELSSRGRRGKHSDTEVIKRLGKALITSGGDFPKAKRMVAKDLGYKTVRRVEQIIRKAPDSVWRESRTWLTQKFGTNFEK